MRTLGRFAIVACAIAGFAVELTIGSRPGAGLDWSGYLELRGGGRIPEAVPVVAGLLALVCAGYAWRRPMAGFVGAWALSTAVTVAVPDWEPFTAVLLALFAVSRYGSARTAYLALLLSAVPLGVNGWNAASLVGPVTPITFGTIGVLWMGVACAVWAAGRALHRSSGRVDRLEESLLSARQRARVAERRAIARDLHDIVAHGITAIALQSAGARALLTSGGRDSATDARVAEALTDIEESATRSMRELHRLVTTLRADGATAEQDTGTAPGTRNLPTLVAATRAGGLRVDLRESGERRPLDHSVDLAVYRTVQEALANAMKHGGRQARVEVALDWPGTRGGAQELRVAVVTHGTGGGRSALPSGGFGLIGLAERLASVDGVLRAEPAADRFETEAIIPLGPGSRSTR